MAVTVQATPYVSSFDETKPFSQAAGQICIASGTAKSYTVPGASNKKYRAEFNCPSTANIFIGYNVTPTVPSSGTVNTSSQEEFVRSGMARYVFGGDVLSFITPDTTQYLSVSLLAIPNS